MRYHGSATIAVKEKIVSSRKELAVVNSQDRQSTGSEFCRRAKDVKKNASTGRTIPTGPLAKTANPQARPMPIACHLVIIERTPR